MKQRIPGTLGSSKLLTQTLSFGDARLNVVLMQPRLSALATPRAGSTSTTARKSDFIADLHLTDRFGQGFPVGRVSRVGARDARRMACRPIVAHASVPAERCRLVGEKWEACRRIPSIS